MITSAASPEAERRTRVKQLAGIRRSYSDDELDVKIDAADQIAIAWFGGLPASSDTGRTENLITVSNMYAATLILAGLGGERVRETQEAMQMLIKDIVAASNDRSPKQHRPTVRTTPGVTPGALGFGQ